MVNARERSLDRTRLYDGLKSALPGVEVWLVAGGFSLKGPDGSRYVSTREARRITGVRAPVRPARRRVDLATNLLRALRGG